jgi:hypothetical protein
VSRVRPVFDGLYRHIPAGGGIFWRVASCCLLLGTVILGFYVI